MSNKLSLKGISYFIDIICLAISFTIIFSFVQLMVFGYIDFVPLILGSTSSIIVLVLLVWYLDVYEYVFYFEGDPRILVVALVIAAIILGYIFFPVSIFPGNASNDFYVYLDMAYKFASGSLGLADALATLHPSIYLLLASILSSFDSIMSNPILLSRLFMILLYFVGLLLVYELGGIIYGRYGGEVAVFASVLFNIFWYFVVIVTGIYANFLGIILILYSFLMVVRYYYSGKFVYLVFIFILSPLSILAHVTSILFYIALFIGMLYSLVVERSVRLFYASISSLVPFVTLIFLPIRDLGLIMKFVLDYLFRLKPYTVGGLVIIRGIDPVESFLSSLSPFLGYFYSQLEYIGIFIIIVMFVLAVYNIYLAESSVALIPWIWFMVCWIFTFFFSDVWRIVLYSLYPSMLFLGILSKYSILDRLMGRFRIVPMFRKLLKFESLLLILLALFILSPSYRFMVESNRFWDYQYTKQRGIYDSMLWLEDNTPRDSIIISIVRWEFKYSRFLIDRVHYGDYYLYPDDLYGYLINHTLGDDVYIVVWKLVRDVNNTLFLYTLYEEHEYFVEVYSNDVIAIFRWVG